MGRAVSTIGDGTDSLSERLARSRIAQIQACWQAPPICNERTTFLLKMLLKYEYQVPGYRMYIYRNYTHRKIVRIDTIIIVR